MRFPLCSVIVGTAPLKRRMPRLLRPCGCAALALLLCTGEAFAQAGGGAGGGGAAGNGAGGAASGQGAGSAGAGAHGTGAAGAGTAGVGSAAQGGAQTGAQNGSQSGPQAYAAGATAAIDPRKPPPAKPGALTLQQVVDRARAQNPTLRAAVANLRGVRAQEIQAGVRANPYFGVNGTNVTLPANGTEGNPDAYAFQFSRLFERGNKREYRLETARANTAQTEAQLNDTVRQTVLLVRTDFVHMIFAKQALDLSKANLADFRHEVEIANDRYKAGDLSRLDFERLDLQLGSFESDAANNEILLQQASAQIQTLIGIAVPSTTFDIAGDIVPPSFPQTKDELIASALRVRPDLLAAEAGVAAAEANIRLQIANGAADPTLEGEFDKSGYYNSFGFNVNLPIRIFDRNQGNKETSRFQAEASRFAVVAARNQVVSDVDQAWVQYVQAKALSDRFGNHYLDEATDVLGIARYAFDHGGLALIDYLDSLRDSRTAVSDALNAYQQTWIAIHQLSESSATELVP